VAGLGRVEMFVSEIWFELLLLNILLAGSYAGLSLSLLLRGWRCLAGLMGR